MSSQQADPPGFGVAQPIDFLPAGTPMWQGYATPAPPPYPPPPPLSPLSPLPPPDPAPTAKRRRWPVVVVATALVAALATAGVPWVVRQTSPGRTPVVLVEHYLTALAAGNAGEALKYGRAQPTDLALLTDAVLASALAANPIADIDVPADQKLTGDQGEVLASYVIGGVEVDAAFAVSKANGTWVLDAAFASLDLSRAPKGVSLTVEGVDVTGKTQIELLPGIYHLATGDPMLVVGDDSLTVPDPAATRFDVVLRLSSLGAERIRQAAATALDACLAAAALAPAGCGFDFDRFYAPVADESTVTRRVISGSSDMSELILWLDYGSTTTASGFPNLIVRLEFTSKTGLTRRFLDYVFDLSANFADPDNISITFN